MEKYIVITEYGEQKQDITVESISCLKSASNLNGNLNCSKELEHYSS